MAFANVGLGGPAFPGSYGRDQSIGMVEQGMALEAWVKAGPWVLDSIQNSLIAYTLGAVATVEMYIALFPAIQDQAEQLNKLLAAYPKGFMEAFGFNGTEALFSRLESYMSTEYFTFFWPINSCSRCGRSFSSNDASSSTGAAETMRSRSSGQTVFRPSISTTRGSMA